MTETKRQPEQQPAHTQPRPVYPGGWALQNHLDYVSKMHEKHNNERVKQQQQQDIQL